MKKHVICVLGGTGFVGRHLVNLLAASGHRIRVPSRHRERHRELLVLPSVQVVDANIHDTEVLREVIKGCDAWEDAQIERAVAETALATPVWASTP
ncbi:MAG: NAD(P)H-binding protein, partial [Gammaproteobacteria bacterium]